MIRNKRALSPVIATVILVAVTIVVAVAVAYWMGGIASLYTRFERIEVTKWYAVKDETSGNYTVTIELKNSGSADATMNYLLVNGRPLEDYNGNITITPSLPAAIQIGKSKEFTIEILGSLYEAGTTLDMTFHSAAGKNYPQMVPLP